MDLPELVRRELDEETVLAHVDLGGDDAVFVTPTRTLVYRAEGLLSDESVAAYDHGVERLELRSGRRKTTFRLGYVDRVEDFAVPSKSANEVLVPLIEGLLRYDGLLDDDETVRGAYRFSELTLVVTDRRVLKHVGGTVWDAEYDEAPFEELTGLGFEEGSVATEMAVEVDGYPERFKIPNDHAGTVRRTLQESVFAYHGVDSLAELESLFEDEAEEEPDDVLERTGFTRLLDDDGEETTGIRDLTSGEGAAEAEVAAEPPEPERERPPAPDPTPTPERAAEPTTADVPDVPDDALAEQVAALRAAVERQEERLERQGHLIEQLVEELRRGR